MLRISMLIVAAAGLAACGGGGPGTGGVMGGANGGSGSGPGSGASSVQGIYYGTFTAPGGGALPVYGTVLPDGTGLLADVPGDVYLLPPLTTPASITGPLAGFAGAGRLFSDGQASISYNLTGSAASPNSNGTDTSISAQVFQGSLQGTLQLNLMGISASVLPLSSLAGSYSGFYWGSLVPANFTLSTGGVIAGNDNSGCTLTGQLSQASGNTDLFQATLEIAGSGCPGALSGVAWDDVDDRGGVFTTPSDAILYIVVSNGSVGRVLEMQR